MFTDLQEPQAKYFTSTLEKLKEVREKLKREIEREQSLYKVKITDRRIS